MRVNVHGERELFAAIDRLTELVSDQRERGWQKNVDVRLDHQRHYMDSEGSGEWPELSVGYARDKEAAVGFLPILQYTTRMYRSLTEEGADNYVREEDTDSLKVGSSDPKASWHHHGAGRLPVREVIRVTDEEGREHLQVFHDSYEIEARALGFRVL
jgi:histone acetyltransferase (RNA polymerase elongator complex component)